MRPHHHDHQHAASTPAGRRAEARPPRALSFSRSAARPAPARDVGELADRYLAWAESYYRKVDHLGEDRSTPTYYSIRRSIELLVDESGLGRRAIEEFGPLALSDFQVWLARDGRWSRQTINTYVQFVVGMFQWGVSRELVTADRLVQLRSVRALRKGRRPAPGCPVPRENREMAPAPLEDVRAALGAMSPTLRRMVQVHALAGMRTAELVAMRLDLLFDADGKPAELGGRRPPQVIVYHVPGGATKTAHHEGRPGRRVYLGPRCCLLIAEQVAEARELIEARGERLTPSLSLWSPRRAQMLRHFAIRQAAIEAGRPVRPASKLRENQRLREHYDRHSYKTAIVRACERAGVEPWTPSRLRHLAATHLAGAESVEVAQQMLGHAEIRTTMRYVSVEDRRQIEAAMRHG